MPAAPRGEPAYEPGVKPYAQAGNARATLAAGITTVRDGHFLKASELMAGGAFCLARCANGDWRQGGNGAPQLLPPPVPEPRL